MTCKELFEFFFRGLAFVCHRFKYYNIDAKHTLKMYLCKSQWIVKRAHRDMENKHKDVAGMDIKML